MEIQTNKLYLKLENTTIKGYFIEHRNKPYSAIGCNFDLQNDLPNAVICENNIDLEQIKVGESKFINGQVVNKEL